MNKVARVFAIYITTFAVSVNALAAEFRGKMVAEWLVHNGGDRDMLTLEPFAFIDDSGKEWPVPVGSIVNGASIPPLFWNTIGPPFVGDYRLASVVHDFYCQSKSETWQDTHRMFYEASILGGVSSARAKVMYAAVYAGGPRWRIMKMIGLEGEVDIMVDESSPGITENRFEQLSRRIELEDLSLSEIEAEIDVNNR